MPTWDDQQYLKFAEARARPARELLARVPIDDARRVLDLGCGPGTSTALLCERWPAAKLIGVDNSPEMLKSARAALPEVEFVAADAAEFRSDQPLDVVFANAVLQWLPDHARLLPALLDQLRPGGALAIQMPYNHREPSHRAMRELPRWHDPLHGVREAPVATPELYYDLLAPISRHVDIWQTRYEQVMIDVAAIVEWVKGTGLRPYLEALPPEHRDAYLRDYAAALEVAYPLRSDGRRLFSFPRLFIVATRQD